MTVAFTISALLLGIIGAVAAGTVTPPPKIAFVTTNANVAPDALTVGPMAGRLGAPLFITNKEALGDATKDALIAYGADLIVVAGGPGTVTDAVLAQIAAATGKTIAPENTAPTSGIVRVYGSGRDETAVALSSLIASYNPKFLPTDATAADSDLLDGKDSTAFLGATAKAADADKLDGLDSTAFMDKTQRTILLYNGTTASTPTDFEKARDIGDVTKVHADTTLRLRLNSHATLSGGTSCAYQLRVDDLNAAGEVLFDGSETIINDTLRTPLTNESYFDGLAAGTYTISLWVRGAGGPTCTDNPGNFTRMVIVEEVSAG